MSLIDVLTTIGKPRITVKFFDATPEEVKALTTLLGPPSPTKSNGYEWLIWTQDNVEVIAWTN
jgi:hypothetical protein